MNLAYVKIGLVLLVLCSVFYSGWHTRDRDFTAYKVAIEAAAKAQEAHNVAVEQQHQLVNEGIKNEYEAKLAAVRNFYSSGVRNPSGGSVSGISPAPKGTDAETAYPILARQCAETTAQLTSLQDWINQQVGIK
jgi:hypothetical protein